MRPFWMIYGIGQGAPTVRHFDEAEAVVEAKRLARLNPDVAFVVLESKHCAIRREVDVFPIFSDPLDEAAWRSVEGVRVRPDGAYEFDLPF